MNIEWLSNFIFISCYLFVILWAWGIHSRGSISKTIERAGKKGVITILVISIILSVYLKSFLFISVLISIAGTFLISYGIFGYYFRKYPKKVDTNSHKMITIQDMLKMDKKKKDRIFKEYKKLHEY